jgi:hypothetical protein
VTTWINLSIFALLPMLVRIPRALWPLRVSAGNPPRFARPFKSFALHTFTGYASDVGQRGDSITTGKIGSTKGPEGSVTSVDGSFTTEVVVTDQFFLTGADGRTQSFQLTGFGAAIGQGHLVSVAWVAYRLRTSEPHFMIHDHTTGETFFHERALRAISFPYPAPYVALLILMILPWPALILFGLLSAWQVSRFRRRGVRPLLDALNAQAERLARTAEPTRAASPAPATTTIAGELKDLAALRDTGALSSSEFEAAKAKLLGM